MKTCTYAPPSPALPLMLLFALSSGVSGCIEDAQTAADDEMSAEQQADAGVSDAPDEMGDDTPDMMDDTPDDAPDMMDEPAPLPPVVCSDEGLNAAFVEITGEVRWEAAEYPQSPWPRGSRVTLTEVFSDWKVEVPLEADGTFAAEMYSGLYRVTVDRCTEDLTCSQWYYPLSDGIFVDAESAAAPVRLSADLQRYEGQVSFDGAPLRLGETSGAAKLIFFEHDTNRPWEVDLDPAAQGIFVAWLPRDTTFDVRWSANVVLNADAPFFLPSGDMRLGEASPDEEGPLSFSLGQQVVRVSGALNLDGEDLPDRRGRSSMQPRGQLRLSGMDEQDNFLNIEIEPSGPVRYDLVLPPGRYDVNFYSYGYLEEFVDPSLSGHRAFSLCPVEGCLIEADGTLDFDVRNAMPYVAEPSPEPTYAHHTLSGTVVLTGDWDPSTGLSPGGLLLQANGAPTGLSYEDTYKTLPISPDGRFEGNVVAGVSYTVYIVGCESDCQAVQPLGRRLLMEDFVLEGDTDQDFEVDIAEVSIHLTVNGEEMADDTLLRDGSVELDRFSSVYEPRAVIRLSEGALWHYASGVEFSIGETGPARIQVKVFSDDYHIALVNAELVGRNTAWQLYRQDVLPIGIHALGTHALTPGGALEFDLQVVNMDRPANLGVELPEHVANRALNAIKLSSDEGSLLWSPVHQAGEATTFKTYAGGYHATLYSHHAADAEGTIGLEGLWIPNSFEARVPLGTICLGE
ncbi:MAG: hypothetical protein ACE366_31165 [Bradymonadia bacterium]